MRNQLESIIEYVEVKFASDYCKEDEILYNDVVWSRKNLEGKILALIEKMQNAFLIKNKLNIVDDNHKNLITKGTRKSVCKNAFISHSISAIGITLTGRSGDSQNNY